jgi:hypothetical protein
MIAFIFFTAIVVLLIFCLNIKDEKPVEKPLEILHDYPDPEDSGESPGNTFGSLIVTRNMGNFGSKVMLDMAERGNPGLQQLDKIISPMFPGSRR